MKRPLLIATIGLILLMAFIIGPVIQHARAAETNAPGQNASSASVQNKTTAIIPLDPPPSTYRYQVERIPADLRNRLFNVVTILVSYAVIFLLRIPLVIVSALNRIVWTIQRKRLT